MTITFEFATRTRFGGPWSPEWDLLEGIGIEEVVPTPRPLSNGRKIQLRISRQRLALVNCSAVMRTQCSNSLTRSKSVFLCPGTCVQAGDCHSRLVWSWRVRQAMPCSRRMGIALAACRE